MDKGAQCAVLRRREVLYTANQLVTETILTPAEILRVQPCAETVVTQLFRGYEKFPVTI